MYSVLLRHSSAGPALGVGVGVGTAVGVAVGSAVGAAVGAVVGAAVGAALGTGVGALVGADEGATVAAAVGADETVADGDGFGAVGLWLADGTGAAAGLAAPPPPHPTAPITAVSAKSNATRNRIAAIIARSASSDRTPPNSPPDLLETCFSRWRSKVDL